MPWCAVVSRCNLPFSKEVPCKSLSGGRVCVCVCVGGGGGCEVDCNGVAGRSYINQFCAVFGQGNRAESNLGPPRTEPPQ